MTGNSGLNRRAEVEAFALKNLRKFIDVIHTMGTQNQTIRNAFEEAPENETRGRDFLETAMDDLMNAFAYIAKDAETEDSISKPYYLIMARARFGDDFSKEDAEENLEARIAQYNDASTMPKLDMPDHVRLIFDRIPQDVLSALAQNWDSSLYNIARNLMNETALAADENKMTLVSIFNTKASVLQQEIAANKQIKQNARTMGDSANDNEGQPKTGTSVVPADNAQREANIKAIRERMDAMREQLKQLGAFGSNDLETLEETISQKNLPEDIAKKVEEEFATAYDTNPASPEMQKIKNYLKWIANLPWDEFSELEQDLNKSEYILDEGHYGMTEAKEAIIEHIAVEKRLGQSNGKILCLVGSPGVGKTSIGKSMAEATGRSYTRLSLGGVRDESTIRGHGRTYLDSRPGRIVEALKQAGTNNPLVLLDEIDKMSHGGPNGDPTAAMLEVLDPEQNKAFRDHYLGIDLDLSNVLFVATANNLGSIPAPLRDRMEIIHMPGYAHEEKIEIATRYLLPKQLAKNGLTDKDLTISRDILGKVVSGYTRELGVRGLEKALGRICRKVATELERGETPTAPLTEFGLSDYLGPEKITKKDVTAKGDRVGIVNGLAFSSVGGSILNIEVTKEPGKGIQARITGNLKQVMTESVRVARAAVIENAESLNLDMDKLGKYNLNIHALAGATPKDGPSAGAAIATAMISTLTDIPIHSNVAMTGEITLHGDVTAIGGLPEKLDGAVQQGATKVLIPAENEKDLAEVPQSVLDKLEIVTVSRIEDVLAHALTQPIPALEKEAEAEKDEPLVLSDDDRVSEPETENGEANDNDNDAKAMPVFISRRPKGLTL